MAFVESLNIDEITTEVHYDDNGVEHIVTFTKDTSDNWNQEEFLNLDVHLDLLNSPLSIIICKYDNVKLIYKAINEVLLNLMMAFLKMTFITFSNQGFQMKISNSLSTI